MKNYHFIWAVSAFILLLPIVTYSQNFSDVNNGAPVSSQFELRFSGGYGFAKGGSPMSDYNLMYNYTSSTATISKEDVNDKYITLGRGVRFEASLIYYVQDNFGVFLGSGYSSGSESAAENMTYIYSSSYSPSTSTSYNYKESLNFGYVPIITGIHFKTTNGIVKPYVGAGAGLFFSTGISTSNVWDNNQNGNNAHIEQEEKMTTNTPIGYIGYIGVNVNIVPAVDLFIEAKATIVSFYLTRTEITKYTVNGADQLPTMKMRDKVVEYEADKNYTQNSADDSQPYFGGAPIPLPGSSTGITVGLSIQL